MMSVTVVLPFAGFFKGSSPLSLAMTHCASELSWLMRVGTTVFFTRSAATFTVTSPPRPPRHAFPIFLPAASRFRRACCSGVSDGGGGLVSVGCGSAIRPGFFDGSPGAGGVGGGVTIGGAGDGVTIGGVGGVTVGRVGGGVTVGGVGITGSTVRCFLT